MSKILGRAAKWYNTFAFAVELKFTSLCMKIHIVTCLHSDNLKFILHVSLPPSKTCPQWKILAESTYLDDVDK